MRWNQNDIKLKIWKFSHKENILLEKQSKLFSNGKAILIISQNFHSFFATKKKILIKIDITPVKI